MAAPSCQNMTAGSVAVGRVEVSRLEWNVEYPKRNGPYGSLYRCTLRFYEGEGFVESYP